MHKAWYLVLVISGSAVANGTDGPVSSGVKADGAESGKLAAPPVAPTFESEGRSAPWYKDPVGDSLKAAAHV